MGQIIYLDMTPGERVTYQDANYFIKQVLDLSTVLIENEETGKVVRAESKNLKKFSEEKTASINRDVLDIPDEDWQEAERRFIIILPVLQNRGDIEIVKKVSEKSFVSIPTIYRWINLYESTGTKSSLAPKPNKGGKGKARLPEEIESIIKCSIEEVYLTKQKKSIRKVCQEVITRCKNAKLKPPHPNSVRNRILSMSEELKLQFRSGKAAAREIYQPHKGSFPGADFPLSVVQIDHTKLDIIVVDEINRKPVGRPWITLAMDVYSRVVLGYYISFDPPGTLSTGMCICHAIMPKEMFLDKLKVSGEWPCYGLMKVLHLDNAKEFRGLMLQKACSEYNIQINWRPVKMPHWGGHIERLLGTFLKELHALPGSTFSKPHHRKYYNSEKNAALTIEELEQWLTTFIVDVYHQKIHTGIGQTPLHKWKEGIFSPSAIVSTGVPRRILDERKLRLDFMPFEERTVQEYGVVIDYIHYYHDVLRKWVNSLDDNTLKAKMRRKFVFKRDPRDISVIYFFDPELKEYYPIPYRNTALPPISIWEFNEVVRRLKEVNEKEIDEEKIFNAYQKLKVIEEQAVLNKSVARRIANTEKRKNSSKKKNEVAETIKTNKGYSANLLDSDTLFNSKDIKPFDELEHGTLN